MNIEYTNIYNNLIKLATNKDLYKGFVKQDTFSDRLILFLFTFCFFLKVYKNEKTPKFFKKFMILSLDN